MSAPMELPGLKRLKQVCLQLALKLVTDPPCHTPPQPGALVAGLPFDPVLAAFYAQVGFAAFATDMDGIVFHRYDNTTREIEEDNQRWSEGYRQNLALPTFVFAGEPFLAYHYATVPSLADEQSRQPVVFVDVYMSPYALPVASTVDRFLDAYSRYLEAFVVNAQKDPNGSLSFPWDVPHIIGRDVTLVEQIRAGRFDPLMPGLEERAWAHKVVAAGVARG